MTEPTLPEESLFLQALEFDSAAEQTAFLDRECGGNAELRASVEALLRHHHEGSGFLESPPTQVVEAGEQLTAREPELSSLGFLESSADSASIGRLGHYEILELLGSGGFGIVLKARDAKLDRIVAIKTLNQSLASSITARRRFVREAKAAAAVKHDNVVGIYHVSDEGTVPYLVMECVSGLSLEEKLQQLGMLDVPAILRIGMQVASGLAAAHQQGLVHRDVKPGNILLENGVERVKITDFGLARAANDAAITRTGDVAGTPQFMSPEQALGQAVDARSDLFSLGSVLYATCTGRSPFRAESTIAALRRVCDDTPRPIREINPEIPEWLVAIIDRLLAKQPDERFKTAAEVADLLGQHLARLQHPTSPAAHIATVSQSQIPNPKSQIRFRRWSLAAAALVLLLVGISFTEATGVTRVVPTVIRIVTGEGTLVVETDPDVQVTIEGNGDITFHLAGGQSIRVPAGRYRVKATRDGQPIPLESELVSIAKGARQVVKVKLETAALPFGQHPGSYAAQDFTPLFNGKDLSGWEDMGGTGNWRVEDGALTCSGPESHLLTVRDDFGDFHLRAEVKINAGGNSGIYFRAHKPLVVFGDYEAQITSNPDQQYKTGSLIGLVRVTESPVPPDTWFTLEVSAEGPRIRILVNGKQTAEYAENRPGRNSQGLIALQHYTPETRVFFRKVEIRELSSARPAAKGAFVLLAAGKERKFDTLAQAVQRASDGDTIEIRGNGPFLSEPINCQKTSLTIRAADGFRPVIKLRPEVLAEKVPLLETNAALVLEGLELHRAPGNNKMAVQSREAPLHAANCRFRAPVWSGGSPIRMFRNCEFLADNALENWRFDSHAATRVSFESCVFCTRYPTISSFVVGAGPRDISIQVKRSTFVTAQSSFQFALISPSQASEAAAPIRVEGLESIFEVSSVVGFHQTRAFLDQAALLEPAEAEATLLRQIQWRGERNLFGAGGASLRWLADQKLEPPHGPKGMDAWKQFWGAAEVGSLERQVRFQGGRLLERTDLDQLTPEDFRLRTDSAGYRAGPDGKDLGADVDLVGPGAAYERWKTTPEYQEWLKETGQLKDRAAAKAEPGTFVLLGVAGVAERKFHALGEAVNRATDGDTIEIRGNGPFVSEPIVIPSGQALIIRAAKGFRPVIKVDPEEKGMDLLNTQSTLVLEGLDLQWVDAKPYDPRPDGRPNCLVVYKGPTARLHVANCRFLMNRRDGIHVGMHCISAWHTPVCHLRNCQLGIGGHGKVMGTTNLLIYHGNRESEVIADNCLFIANAVNLGLVDAKAITAVLNRSTLLGSPGLSWQRLQKFDPPLATKGSRLLQVETSANIFHGPFVFNPNAGLLAKEEVLSAGEAAELLTKLVDWREKRNLYFTTDDGDLLRLVVRSPEKGEERISLSPTAPIKTLSDWMRFWDLQETDSQQGQPKFQGGDLLTKAGLTPHLLTPEDFRLRPDSPGYRAGPDGKDLGADVELVGPGAAYERWKQTPEYQEWLKETKQVSGP